MTSMCASSVPRTILVVEDDADIREMLALLLELEGYAVAAVNDGLEALEWLDRGEEPALVLLDLMMPNLDGWGFLERWQSRAAAARCPVVVLSGADVRGPVGGAHCVLRKPVGTEELLQLVKSLAKEPELAPV